MSAEISKFGKGLWNMNFKGKFFTNNFFFNYADP